MTATTTRDWTPTASDLPPEGEVVETMDSGGHVQKLVCKGNRWFFTDMSMYIYYVPTYWRKP